MPPPMRDGYLIKNMINMNNLGEKLGLCILTIYVHGVILLTLWGSCVIVGGSLCLCTTFMGFTSYDDWRAWVQAFSKIIFGTWGFLNVYGWVMIIFGWKNHIHQFLGRLIFGVFR